MATSPQGQDLLPAPWETKPDEPTTDQQPSADLAPAPWERPQGESTGEQLRRQSKNAATPEDRQVLLDAADEADRRYGHDNSVQGNLAPAPWESTAAPAAPAAAPAPLAREYPDRVPPAPAAPPPAPPEDPELARARRAAQHLKVEDLMPSRQAEYPVPMPSPLDVPEISPVIKAPAPKPTLTQRLLHIDPEAAAARAARVEFDKGPMAQPALGPDATMLEGLRSAWNDFTRPIYRSTEALPREFVNTATFGLSNALYDAFGFDSPRARQAETQIESTVGSVGDLLGFIAGPAKVAHSMTAGAFGSIMAREAVEDIPRLFTREWAERFIPEIASQAATLGVASGLAHIGDYGREMTLEDAYRAMGQHVLGGAEMGAVFGAAGAAFPGGWGSFRGMLRDIRDGAPDMTQNAIQTVGRLAIGTAALDASQGTTPWDDRNLGQKIYDYGLNAYFLARGGPSTWERFDAQAQAAGQDPFTALRDIRVRRQGDDIVIEKLTPRQGQEAAPIYAELGRVGRDHNDYQAGLDELFPEAKAPVSTSVPNDYEAGLDDIFGEAGKGIAQRAAEARERILGTDQDPEIAIRGIDIRGKIGQPGWEKNVKLMNDLASVGAAHLWRGDRTLARWSTQMVREFGEDIKPQLPRLYKDAQEGLSDLKDIVPDKIPTAAKVLALFHAGREATPESLGLDPAFWYDKAAPELKRMFGRNADLYAKLLAATSAHSSVPANITHANKAFIQVLTGRVTPPTETDPGKPFKSGGGKYGFMSGHADNLNRVLRGEPLQGPKVGPFARALMGDKHAIVVDTWMLRAFGLGDASSDAKIMLVQGAVARMAREFNLDERQVQAAIWSGIKRKVEGAKTKLPPIDQAIENRIAMLRPYLEALPEDIARRAPDANENPLVGRLAALVARGRANGVDPARMFTDFTSRGADPAIATQAIRVHFPEFGGAHEGTQAAPVRGPEAAAAGQPSAAPQPEARPAGVEPEAGRGPVVQPQPAAAAAPEVRRPAPEPVREPVPGPGRVEPAGGPGVPERPGAAGAVGPVGGPADVSGRPGVPAGESRLRTVFPRAGTAVATDPRLQPYVDILRPHQAEDASLILRGLDSEQRAYGLFNGAGSGKTYVALTTLDVHRRMGSRALYVAPANVLQIDPKTGEAAGTVLEASRDLGIPIKIWDGKSPIEGDAIHVMTYEKWKRLPPDPNAVIYFDEAHALKNVETAGPTARATHGAEWMRVAKGVILGTATPLDKSIHIPYLERLGVYEGKSKEEALAGLGIVAEMGRNGIYFKSLNEAETTQKIEALFERLGTKGLMSSRWIHMDGVPVFLKSIPIDQVNVDRMSQRLLEGYHVDSPEDLTGVYKMHYGENMRRQLEPYKIKATVDLVKNELAEGRQVVIYVSRINKSIARQPKRLGGRALVESFGTAETLKAHLQVNKIQDIADLHGNSDLENAQAVEAFQSGKARVLIATPESGSSGINLDANKPGMAPRTTIVMTAPYGGTENVQIAGRTWRLNTQNIPRYYYLDSGHETDSRNLDIVAGKLRTLGAVVQTDTAAKIANPEIAQRQERGPAPVKFQGLWALKKNARPMEIWNLTEDIPGHPKGSTLSRDTLEAEGYQVPPAPPQTQSKPFQDWFKESKVVGSDGKPLVVYHGTIEDFKTFRKKYGLAGHFGSIEQATDRVLHRDFGRMRLGIEEGKGPSLMPVYLSIQHPIRMADVHFDETLTFASDLNSRGVLSNEEFADLQRRGLLRSGRREEGMPIVVDMLKQKGYDGIVYSNYIEGSGEDSWIPFEPSQIKSATGNQGTFNAAMGDITRRGGVTSGWIDWTGKEESADGSAVHGQLLDEHWPEIGSGNSDVMLERGAVRYVDEGGDHVSIEIDPTSRIAVERAIRELGRTWKDYPSVLIEYHDKAHVPFAPKEQPERFPTFMGSRRDAQADLRKYLDEGTIARRADTEEKAKFQTRAFRRWFGQSRIVDADGKPLDVYHGTTHDFSEFGPQRTNPEGAIGRGFYFSSDPYDAGRNYAGVRESVDGQWTETPEGVNAAEFGIGKDLEGRIMSRAEELDQQMERDDPTLEKDERWQQAMGQARSELFGGAPNIMPVHLAIRNPVVLKRQGGTRFSVFSDENTGREWGNGVDLYDAIQSVADEMGFNGQKVWDHIVSREGLDETPAYDIWRSLQESPELGDLTDEDGRLAQGEAVRRIFQEAGHDGIVLHDADKEYRGMGLNPDTTHYIAFEPTQIKSAIGNRGTWSLQHGDITRRDDGEFEAREPGALAPSFYLKSTKVVEAKIQNGMKPDQIIKTLVNNQIGKEELKWSGLEPYLNSIEGKITKQQVLDYLKGQDLTPSVFMQGGPTPTGAKKLDLIDVGPLEARSVETRIALETYKTELLGRLEEALQRQNELAKARGKRKRNMPKDQIALPGMESEESTSGLRSFEGQPGLFGQGEIHIRARYDADREPPQRFDVILADGSPYMQGYSTRARAEETMQSLLRNGYSNTEPQPIRRTLRANDYHIDAQYNVPMEQSRFAVRRNGEVIGRFENRTDAEEFVSEQRDRDSEAYMAALPAYPDQKPEKRWKVNAAKRAKELLEFLEVPATGDEASEIAQNHRIVGALLKMPVDKITGIREKWLQMQVENRAATKAFQDAVDENNRKRREQRLPDTQYGEYAVKAPGFDNYFEMGAHMKLKRDPEIKALEARRDELTAARENLQELPDPEPANVKDSDLEPGWSVGEAQSKPATWIQRTPNVTNPVDSLVGENDQTIGYVKVVSTDSRYRPKLFRARLQDRSFARTDYPIDAPIYKDFEVEPGRQELVDFALADAKQWVTDNVRADLMMAGLKGFRAFGPETEQSPFFAERGPALVFAVNAQRTSRYNKLTSELEDVRAKLRDLNDNEDLFTAPHFGDRMRKNLLYHTRGYIVTMPDGKKLLFLQEIQSDWSIAGRGQGWKQPPVTELPPEYKIEAKQYKGASDARLIIEKIDSEARNWREYPWAVIPRNIDTTRIKMYGNERSARNFLSTEGVDQGGEYLRVENLVRLREQARQQPESTAEGDVYTEYVVTGPNDYHVTFGTEERARQEALEHINRQRQSGVAEAPFVVRGNWTEHAMKWALRYAAEQGYDGVGWASGEMNADLYNLRKAIDRLEAVVDPQKADTYNITAYKGDRQVWNGPLKDSELEENLGQTLAARVRAQTHDPAMRPTYWVVPEVDYYDEGTYEHSQAKARARAGRGTARWLVIETSHGNQPPGPNQPIDPARAAEGIDKVIDYELSQEEALEKAKQMQEMKQAVLSGIDLEMGGEHHKALYNRMIPSFMNKYTKQWNGKVEDIPYVEQAPAPAPSALPSVQGALRWTPQLRETWGGANVLAYGAYRPDDPNRVARFGAISRPARITNNPIWTPFIYGAEAGGGTTRGPGFPTAEEAQAWINRSWEARNPNAPRAPQLQPGQRYADMPGARTEGDWEVFDSRTGRVYNRFDTENEARTWMNAEQLAAQADGRDVSFDYDRRNPNRGIEAIDREIERVEEQRRLAAAAGRPFAEMQPLDARLDELARERAALEHPPTETHGLIHGKHDEEYKGFQGVWITPEMRQSVLYTGQPLFREAGRITGEGVKAGLEKGVQIGQTGIPVIDSLGIHQSDIIREIADRPYMQALTREVKTGIGDIAQALSDLHENIQFAGLKGMDVFMEGNTLAYNRVGMNEIFLNLHAHIVKLEREYASNPDIPESVKRIDLARDLARSMVWEVMRQAHPGAEQYEMRLITSRMVRKLQDRGSVYDDVVGSLVRALEGTNGYELGSLDARSLRSRQADAERAARPQGSNEPGAAGPVGEPPVGARAPAGPGVHEAAPEGGPARTSDGEPAEGLRPVPPALRAIPEPGPAGPAGVRRPDVAATMAGAQAEATRAAIEFSRGVSAPPAPYTLGGGTATRTPVGQTILTKLRKDKIIQDFGEALRDMGKGGLVLQGGIANKKALGQAHRLSGNVRLRYITDIDTAAHEFGHRLQDALGIRDADLGPYAGELAALKAVGNVQGPTLSEGFGEFWRMHALDPVTAARLAPNLYRYAEARLRMEPMLDAGWQAFRNQAMELRSQNPIDRMAGAIAWPDQQPSMTQQVRETMAIGHLRSLVRANLFAYFDQTLPFRLVTEAAEKAQGAALPASKDPFKWSRTLSARVIDTVKGFQHEGVMDWTTREPVPGSRSFEAIVRDVAGNLRDFQTYEVLKRAQFLARSNKPDGTPNEIHRATAAHLLRLADLDAPTRDTAINTLESTYPHFKGVLDDLQGWNKGLLKFMQDSGAYSADAIAAIEQANDLYVPLHRLMDPAGPGAWGSGESTVNVGRAIKRLGGKSERLILPTLQTRMRQALMMVGTAERNYAGSILFDAIKKIPNYGTLADEVPAPLQPTMFQLADVKGAIKRAFQQSGQDPRVVDLVDMNKLATIFQPNVRDLPNNQVLIYKNGEPKIWQVNDPLLLKAATHMGPDEARAWGQAMGLMGSLLYKMVKIPAKAIQFNVVHGIDFLVGHLVRSAQEQGLQGYMVPPVLRGVKDIATGGRVKERYLSGGGRVFNFEDYSPEGIQRSLDRLGYTTSNPLNPQYWQEGGVKRPFSDFVSVLDAAGRLFDEPARVGVAKLAYDAPRTVDTTELDKIVEAAFRGRESGLDFNQRGASQLFNRYLSLVPFSHAVATGLYRNLRNYRQGVGAISNEGLKAIFGTAEGHPERRYARGLVMYGGMMLLAALYNEWANHSDPRYQALTDQEKTGYFHFLPPWERRFTAEEWESLTPDEQVQYGSPYIKISKPWWPGFFQATLPAEALQGLITQEQTAGQTIQKMWGSFLQSSRIDALPTSLRVPLELALNRQNVLTLGSKPRPITPDFQMRLAPEKRYGPDTRETTKQIAAALRHIPGLSEMSPRDVEYLTRSFGYLPMYGVELAETVEQAFGGKDMPEPPAKRWGEYPGVQRFVQRFPESHPQVVNDMDAVYKQSTQVAATYKQKVADHDPDSLEYLEQHRGDIAVAPLATAWAKHMKLMWKQVDRIKLDHTLTAEEKRQRIDLLFLDVLNQSNRFMSRINDMKRPKD